MCRDSLWFQGQAIPSKGHTEAWTLPHPPSPPAASKRRVSGKVRRKQAATREHRGSYKGLANPSRVGQLVANNDWPQTSTSTRAPVPQALLTVKGRVTAARSVYGQSHRHGHHSRETQMSLEELGRIRNKHGPNLNNSAQVGKKNTTLPSGSSRYCGSAVTCHGPRGPEGGGWRMGGGEPGWRSLNRLSV